MDGRPPEDDFEAVRFLLEADRGAGVPFEVAWASAIEALVPLRGHDHAAKERGQAIGALAATQNEWRRAYERLPPLPAEHPMVRYRQTLELETAA